MRFSGQVNGSSTENVALLVNGYQNAYGNLYSEPTDVFVRPTPRIAGVLPSTTPISTLYSESLLPRARSSAAHRPPPNTPRSRRRPCPFSLATVFASGFAPGDYLILNSYRLAYLEDEQANPDGGFPTVDHRPARGVAEKHVAAGPQNQRSSQLDADHAVAAMRRTEILTFFFFNTQRLMQGYWSKNAPGAPATARTLRPRRRQVTRMRTKRTPSAPRSPP